MYLYYTDTTPSISNSIFIETYAKLHFYANFEISTNSISEIIHIHTKNAQNTRKEEKHNRYNKL